MHRTGLILIFFLAFLLGVWGYTDLARDNPPADLPEAARDWARMFIVYVAAAKIVAAAFIAAICVGFDGVLAAMADIRRRHPGIKPPLPWPLRWLFEEPRRARVDNVTGPTN